MLFTNPPVEFSLSFFNSKVLFISWMFFNLFLNFNRSLFFFQECSIFSYTRVTIGFWDILLLPKSLLFDLSPSLPVFFFLILHFLYSMPWLPGRPMCMGPVCGKRMEDVWGDTSSQSVLGLYCSVWEESPQAPAWVVEAVLPVLRKLSGRRKHVDFSLIPVFCHHLALGDDLCSGI